MLCDKCKKQLATYHFTTVVNGMMSEEHVCESCAERTNSSFAELVSGLFSQSIFDIIGFEDSLCDCGTTFSDIARTGVVGCNNCQPKYKGILGDAIRSIQIGADKAREEMGVQNPEQLQKVIELRHKLADAVAKEDYELASDIKKEIDKLKSSEGGNV